MFSHFQTTMKTLHGYLFKLLGWKNLARQHEIEKATMVYKPLLELSFGGALRDIQKNGCEGDYLYPGWLQNIYVLSLQYEKRHITLETENKLCIPLPRANHYKNSFSYSGAILWNKFPCNVRQAESL